MGALLRMYFMITLIISLCMDIILHIISPDMYKAMQA